MLKPGDVFLYSDPRDDPGTPPSVLRVVAVGTARRGLYADWTFAIVDCERIYPADGLPKTLSAKINVDHARPITVEDVEGLRNDAFDARARYRAAKGAMGS